MKTEIKTKRLTLCPMSDAEIEALIERTPSDELRAAYGEMLSGGKSDPGNRVWYAPWSMVLKDAQEYVCTKSVNLVDQLAFGNDDFVR